MLDLARMKASFEDGLCVRMCFVCNVIWSASKFVGMSENITRESLEIACSCLNVNLRDRELEASREESSCLDPRKYNTGTRSS